MLNKLMSAWRVIDDRTGIVKLIKPLMEHKAPRESKWAYVFGSAILFSFLLQVVTGVILATMYVPSAESAYRSLKYIQDQALFGSIVRGMHYFGASSMILFLGIHMLRVFMYASYKYPREANWLSGVVLLIFTLVMGFSGQLLRYDQDAVWSANIAVRQADRVPVIGHYLEYLVYSGDTLSGATLTRFYDLHVFLIPAGIFFFIGLHLYLVILHGISAPPKAGQPVDPATEREKYKQLLKTDGVPFWPDAAWRDALFGSLVIAAVISLAIIIGAPHLSGPPDPRALIAYPKPDWYLLWYFAVLALSPHALESYIIIIAPILIFGFMFLLPFLFNKGERSPRRRPWAMAWVVLLSLGVLSLWYQGKIVPWQPRFLAQQIPDNVYASGDPSVHRGAILFHDKGCEFCHLVKGHGGIRGPDLTNVADRLTAAQIQIRILTGGNNMPAFAGILHPDQLTDIVHFLTSINTVPGPTLNPAVRPRPKGGD